MRLDAWLGRRAKLKATGKARVVSPSAVGSQVPAISNEDLAAIGAKHLPVVVENATRKSDGMNVSILWQVRTRSVAQSSAKLAGGAGGDIDMR